MDIMRLDRITFAGALRLAPAETTAPAADMRYVSGLVVPFDMPVQRPWGETIFTAAGTVLPERLDSVKLLTEHDPGHPVGYATAAEVTPAGLHMTFAVPADHDRAAGYLADLDANLRDGFSVGIEMTADTLNAIMDRFWGSSDDSTPIVMAGTVREVSAVCVTAFNDARADSAHAAAGLARFTATTREEPSAMPDTIAPPAPAPLELPTVEELAAAVADFMATTRAPSTHPLAAFTTYDAYAAAIWDGTVERFALVDQITTDNPGVVPPAWLTDVVGIIDIGRPGITAFGGAKSLPDGGMELTWPLFAGDITTIVAAQAAEKTEVHSTKVSFTKGQAPLATYAGASDVSYQLLRRSSPAYRDLYNQILQLAYAATTDNAFVDALAAVATAYPVAGGIGDADALRGALFGASAAVQRATGAPANVVLAAPDVFELWGGFAGLYPRAYGTQNASGTAQAADLSVNVSGLEVTCDPYLAAGTALVSNQTAAQWFEDGPFPVEQDDVAKLGRDIGIWGMGATRVAVPAGVLALTAGATRGASK